MRARNAGRQLLAQSGLLLLIAFGCAGDATFSALGEILAAGSSSGRLGEDTIIAGLREALRTGSQRAVRRSAQRDGFLGNPDIRIGLPESTRSMTKALRTVGFAAQLDEFEVAMNRAAERAAADAFDVFADAVRAMSFSDAREILNGSESAASDYFRGATEPELRARFQPIVAEQMGRLGLVKSYDRLVRRYRKLPFAGAPRLNLHGYVTEKALDGLFTLLAEEERKIRTDPAARSSEILVRVFGS